MFLVGAQWLSQSGDKDDHNGAEALSQSTVPIGARYGVKRYRNSAGNDYHCTWRGETTFSVRQSNHEIY